MTLRLSVFLVAAAGCALMACETKIDTEGAGGEENVGGAGGTEDPGVPTQGCEVGSLAAGTHDIAISHDGFDRTYRLHLPPSYEAGTPVPLVLNFHGLGSNGNEQSIFSAMDLDANEQGYAVLYPNGIDNSWNGGSVCCGTAAEDMIDDVGFARALVEHAGAQACFDATRVYATGMSNGGFMSHRLGCEASDLVAAVAPVAGLMGIPVETCNPTRPVPIIHFYGTADNLVPYAFADDVNAEWVDNNGCTGEPTVTYQEGLVTCTTHSECNEGASVTLCSVEGMGHCWPGQGFCPFGEANTDISANVAMWELFQQHRLPAPE